MGTQSEFQRRFVRGHGSDIFWGSLSLFFAGAACYFFYTNRDNELRAREATEQLSILQQEKSSLRGQVEKLQSSVADVRVLLDARDRKLKQQEAELSGLTARAAELAKARTLLQFRDTAREEIDKKMRESVAAYSDLEFIKVVDRGGQPILRIENSALFVPGEMKLTPESQQILKGFGEAVKEQLGTYDLRLEAFTDSDPIVGSMKDKFASNTELSAARAATVARFLIDNVSLPRDRVVVVARGESMPVVPNDTSDNKAKNRRLEVLLEPRVVSEETSEGLISGAEDASAS